MAAPAESFAITYEEGGRNVYVLDRSKRAVRYDHASAHAAYDELRDGRAGLAIVDYSDVPEAQRQRVKGG